MNQDRFANLFGARPSQNEVQPSSLQGFTVNPLTSSLTPTQVAMYQAAYEQAQRDLEEPEWPMAECWN